MNRSTEFFDRQFRAQALAPPPGLNPFEAMALPLLGGDVLDFGCGLGQLALAAARRGCRVTAFDASAAAIGQLQRRAVAERLPLHAEVADLRLRGPGADYDAVVCIGLLMFFDCPTAWRVLGELQDHVRPGGLAVVNVLVEGTTYRDMFDPDEHCLFAPGAIVERFAGWQVLVDEQRDFDAPGATIKRFATLVARKPFDA